MYIDISHLGNMHLGKSTFKDRDIPPPLDQLVKASTCVLKVQFIWFVSYRRNRIITTSKILFLFAFTLESTYFCRSLVLGIIVALLSSSLSLQQDTACKSFLTTNHTCYLGKVQCMMGVKGKYSPYFLKDAPAINSFVEAAGQTVSYYLKA